MLQQFNFENFRSFRDSVSLDLCAGKITEFENTIVKEGGERILPAIAIYGANASGKSNVLDAFAHMCNYVRNSFTFGADDDESKCMGKFEHDELDSARFHLPFRFDSNSVEKPSEFEVFYTDKDGKTINYGFSADKQGIAEEWLFITSKSRGSKPRQIINRIRSENILEFSGIPNKSEENIRIALKDEVLVLSLGSLLKIKLLENVYNWFSSVRFIDYGNVLNLIRISFKAPPMIAEDEELRKRLVAYLSSFDKSIVGIKAEKVQNEENEYRVKIDTLHKMVDSGEVVTLPLNEESDGTKKMFSMFNSIDKILASGSVLVIDELNARLHPLLVRNLLTLFLDSNTNPNHAQIIFTCHDAWLLKANILRRDEIWFTEKDTRGLSNLYSLADFVDDEGYKIRKDADYEKNYLIGKYGAIPTLESLDMFVDRSEDEGGSEDE